MPAPLPPEIEAEHLARRIQVAEARLKAETARVREKIAAMKARRKELTKQAEDADEAAP